MGDDLEWEADDVLSSRIQAITSLGGPGSNVVLCGVVPARGPPNMKRKWVVEARLDDNLPVRWGVHVVARGRREKEGGYFQLQAVGTFSAMVIESHEAVKLN